MREAETSAFHKPPAGENHLVEHVSLVIKYWRQLHSSLNLHHCRPTPSLLTACSLLSPPSLCCQTGEARACSSAEGTVKLNKNKEQRSCLRCVTQLFCRLFLPPLFIIFPLSYICLRQLSWEVFVTKKPACSLSVYTLWLGQETQHQKRHS